MAARDEFANPWLVACLCADWCHVGQDYRAVFDLLADAAAFVWVDIEDDEDALGSVDVDDFPTLLIARGGRVFHFAAVVPNAVTGQRLVRRALAGELAPRFDEALAGLPARLHALRLVRGRM